MLLVAALWGSAFIGQRYAIDAAVPPFLFIAARKAVDSCALVLIILALRGSLKLAREEFTHGAVLGVLLFLGSALQQIGLETTTAGKSGFITGLYLVIVPLLLSCFWRKRVEALAWFAAALGVIGLALLSLQNDWTVSIGDVLTFAGAFAWSFHLIGVSMFTRKSDPLNLALVQFGSCSLLAAALSLFFEPAAIEPLRSGLRPILYVGIVSTAGAYTLQLAVQRFTSETAAAVICGLESVFAAAFGWFFLYELLSLRQLAGCALMLTAAIIAQLSRNKTAFADSR